MRHEDWQARLWAAIDDAGKRDFLYGEHDCVLFAARVADAITVNGKYIQRAREAFAWHSEFDAVRLTRDRGLSGCVETVLGPPVPWVQLGMGDLVLCVDDQAQELMAVHDGAQLMGVRRDGTGLLRVPFRMARHGWRID